MSYQQPTLGPWRCKWLKCAVGHQVAAGGGARRSQQCPALGCATRGRTAVLFVTKQILSDFHIAARHFNGRKNNTRNYRLQLLPLPPICCSRSSAGPSRVAPAQRCGLVVQPEARTSPTGEAARAQWVSAQHCALHQPACQAQCHSAGQKEAAKPARPSASPSPCPFLRKLSPDSSWHELWLSTHLWLPVDLVKTFRIWQHGCTQGLSTASSWQIL